MEKNKKYQLLLAFQNALLFNITYGTRLILADVIESKLIIWVYLDREPTVHEKDVYYSVSAEITGDFLELDESLSEVQFLTESFSEESLKDRLLLFARCDYLDLDGKLK